MNVLFRGMGRSNLLGTDTDNVSYQSKLVSTSFIIFAVVTDDVHGFEKKTNLISFIGQVLVRIIINWGLVSFKSIFNKEKR